LLFYEGCVLSGDDKLEEGERRECGRSVGELLFGRSGTKEVCEGDINAFEGGQTDGRGELARGVDGEIDGRTDGAMYSVVGKSVHADEAKDGWIDG